ncbi:MAG: aminomethyltransferase family protein [Rubellimicrobium sp.]|nr:aminomethyltransferase family protein [Rubellimicrobium sp.]
MTDQRHHFRQPLQRSPFHPRIEAANVLNAWAPWAGYTTALNFGDVAMEHSAIRSTASVYDVSPMIKYAIEGPDAVAYLDRLTLRRVAGMPVGGVQYTAWCNDAGHVLDDGTLFRFDETRFRLCCQERHLPWLLDSAIGFDVTIRDVTEEVAGLSLQGPTSFAVLKAAGAAELADLKPFRMAEVRLGPVGPVTVSRTGFTADLGYELWVAPERALDLWDHLMISGRLHGIRPVGTEALNIARIEAGFITANADFVCAEHALRPDRARQPDEIGLDWMVDLDKGPFNGRAAIRAARRDRTLKWALVGLDIEGNISAEGSIVYLGGRKEVGQITAAVWSPTTKRNIALAQLLRPWHRDAGDKLRVEIYALRELQYHKLMLPARVVKRPFFNPPRRRATPPAMF